MRDHRLQVEAAGGDDGHQTAHALLAAGAQRGDQRLVGQPGRKGVDRQRQLAGVHAQARQGAARLEGAQAVLERLLGAERLDRNIDALAPGQPHDFADRVGFAVIDGVIGPQLPGHLQALRDGVDSDDATGAAQPCAGGGAQADGALRENGDRIAEPDAAVFGAAKPGTHDVRAHQHLLIGQAVGNRRQIRHRKRHFKILGLAAVDRVAEAPAADGVTAALRLAPVQAGMALATRRDGAHDHALANLVPGHAGAQFVDRANWLVPDRQARLDGILAFQDMDIGAADRRQRDLDDGFARPGDRNGFAVQDDAAGAGEDCCVHHVHENLRCLRACCRAAGNDVPICRVVRKDDGEGLRNP